MFVRYVGLFCGSLKGDKYANGNLGLWIVYGHKKSRHIVAAFYKSNRLLSYESNIFEINFTFLDCD